MESDREITQPTISWAAIIDVFAGRAALRRGPEVHDIRQPVMDYSAVRRWIIR